LQRLNGSAKKVKGSLLDKSVRIDMDSPVFRKLQEAIEHPCRSREWFALAEQAINTVYALGDQPEVLSNAIIKNLTRRAFRRREKAASSSAPEDQPSSSSTPNPDTMDEDPPPQSTTQALISTVPGSTQGTSVADPAKKSDDTGDAFELSQLLFVVGHVAIKHIVYLELVEREWKRQKQEKELGELFVPASLVRCGRGAETPFFFFW
jgi:condensin complex subunit 1